MGQTVSLDPLTPLMFKYHLNVVLLCHKHIWLGAHRSRHLAIGGNLIVFPVFHVYLLVGGGAKIYSQIGRGAMSGYGGPPSSLQSMQEPWCLRPVCFFQKGFKQDKFLIEN